MNEEKSQIHNLLKDARNIANNNNNGGGGGYNPHRIRRKTPPATIALMSRVPPSEQKPKTRKEIEEEAKGHAKEAGWNTRVQAEEFFFHKQQPFLPPPREELVAPERRRRKSSKRHSDAHSGYDNDNNCLSPEEKEAERERKREEKKLKKIQDAKNKQMEAGWNDRSVFDRDQYFSVPVVMNSANGDNNNGDGVTLPAKVRLKKYRVVGADGEQPAEEDETPEQRAERKARKREEFLQRQERHNKRQQKRMDGAKEEELRAFDKKEQKRKNVSGGGGDNETANGNGGGEDAPAAAAAAQPGTSVFSGDSKLLYQVLKKQDGSKNGEEVLCPSLIRRRDNYQSPLPPGPSTTDLLMAFEKTLIEAKQTSGSVGQKDLPISLLPKMFSEWIKLDTSHSSKAANPPVVLREEKVFSLVEETLFDLAPVPVCEALLLYPFDAVEKQWVEQQEEEEAALQKNKKGKRSASIAATAVVVPAAPAAAETDGNNADSEVVAKQAAKQAPSANKKQKKPPIIPGGGLDETVTLDASVADLALQATSRQSDTYPVLLGSIQRSASSSSSTSSQPPNSFRGVVSRDDAQWVFMFLTQLVSYHQKLALLSIGKLKSDKIVTVMSASPFAPKPPPLQLQGLTSQGMFPASTENLKVLMEFLSSRRNPDLQIKEYAASQAKITREALKTFELKMNATKKTSSTDDTNAALVTALVEKEKARLEGLIEKQKKHYATIVQQNFSATKVSLWSKILEQDERFFGGANNTAAAAKEHDGKGDGDAVDESSSSTCSQMMISINNLAAFLALEEVLFTYHEKMICEELVRRTQRHEQKRREAKKKRAQERAKEREKMQSELAAKHAERLHSQKESETVKKNGGGGGGGKPSPQSKKTNSDDSDEENLGATVVELLTSHMTMELVTDPEAEAREKAEQERQEKEEAAAAAAAAKAVLKPHPPNKQKPFGAPVPKKKAGGSETVDHSEAVKKKREELAAKAKQRQEQLEKEQEEAIQQKFEALRAAAAVGDTAVTAKAPHPPVAAQEGKKKAPNPVNAAQNRNITSPAATAAAEKVPTGSKEQQKLVTPARFPYLSAVCTMAGNPSSSCLGGLLALTAATSSSSSNTAAATATPAPPKTKKAVGVKLPAEEPPAKKQPPASEEEEKPFVGNNYDSREEENPFAALDNVANTAAADDDVSGDRAFGDFGGGGKASAVHFDHEAHLKAGKKVARRPTVSSESYSEADIESFTPEVYPKSNNIKSFLLSSVLEKHNLFSHLEEFELSVAVDAMVEVSRSSGEHLFEEGDEEADLFYAIYSGKVEVSSSSQEKTVAIKGHTLQESSLLFPQTCTQTATCLEDTTYYVLDRNTYRCILAKASKKKRALYGDFLKKVKWLSGLTSQELLQLADALKPKIFHAGQALIRYGDVGENFYLIVEGTVDVFGRKQAAGAPTGVEEVVKVCEFGPGDCVGELEFINNHKCVADVKASTSCSEVRTAVMNRHHFEMVMGPVKDVLARNAMESETYEYYREKVGVAANTAVVATAASGNSAGGGGGGGGDASVKEEEPTSVTSNAAADTKQEEESQVPTSEPAAAVTQEKGNQEEAAVPVAEAPPPPPPSWLDEE